MRDQLRGCVKIRARGSRLYRFINDIHRRNIAIFEQHVKGGILCAEVYRRDLKHIEELAAEHSVELRCTEAETLSAKLLRRKNRVGIILGAVLVLGAFLYFSGMIVTIEIRGSSKVPESDIICALNELGISEGTPFGQINYVWCENQLRLMVDGISWVGMQRTGNRLVVEVTEVVDKPEMLNERMPCNVVAAHDAEIVYTSVLDGQLMHTVREYVPKGTILINGVTSDATKHVTLHHAMGEIIGIYKDEAIFEGQFTRQRFVGSSELQKRRVLRLFGIKIPLYFGKNDYEYHEDDVTVKPVDFFGKRVPISLETTVCREMLRIETTLDEDALRRELMEKIYLYEKNFLSDCDILDRGIFEGITENGMTLTVKYRIKGDIGESHEIMVK